MVRHPWAVTPLVAPELVFELGHALVGVNLGRWLPQACLGLSHFTKLP